MCIMRYRWQFPHDVCGNSDDAYVHAIVVLFTLYHAARAPKRRLTLVLFALLEFSHGCGHYYSTKSGPWLWAYLHYTVIATAYSIKPAPLRVFVPFLCVDMIGHLVGNDILSIATTLTFSATRFDSNGMKLALAVTLVLFAFMELVACEWSNGHLHEAWDVGLALAMMAGVRWYALTT